MDLRVIKASADQCASLLTKAMKEASESIHPEERSKRPLRESHPALMELMDAITLVQMEVGAFGEYLEPHDEREGAHTRGFRKFVLIRNHDVTGVSGTGVIADGVQFTDGSVTLRWRGDTPSTITYASVDDVLKVHGHGGHTRVMWLDGATVLMVLPEEDEPEHEHEWYNLPRTPGTKRCTCGERRKFTQEEVEACEHKSTTKAMLGVIMGRQCLTCGAFKGNKESWRWLGVGGAIVD